MSKSIRRYSLKDRSNWQRDAEEWDAPVIDWALIEAEQESRSRFSRADINNPNRTDRSIPEQG